MTAEKYRQTLRLGEIHFCFYYMKSRNYHFVMVGYYPIIIHYFVQGTMCAKTDLCFSFSTEENQSFLQKL